MGGGFKRDEWYRFLRCLDCAVGLNEVSVFRCVTLSVACIISVYIGASFRGIILYASASLYLMCSYTTGTSAAGCHPLCVSYLYRILR